jgi:hypothetical protein
MRRWYVDGGFIMCVVVYALLQTWIGRFVHIDEVGFKAAGREWAASGRFASMEGTGIWTMHGFHAVEPPPSEIYFLQPPLYPFSFGLFVKALGFGPGQCILFDALIHAALAFVTYLTAKQFTSYLSVGQAFLIGLAVLPLGTTSRPEELATCFGMTGLYFLLPSVTGYRQVICSGCLFGLCAATSLAGAALLGMIAAVLLLMALRPLVGRLTQATVWGMAAACTLALAIAPILVSQPDAYKQLLSHAGDHVGMAGYLQSLQRAWKIGPDYLLLLFGLLLLAPISLWLGRGAYPRRLWLDLWLGPLLAFVLMMVFLPGKFFYTWVLGPWLLVANAVSLRVLLPLLPRWQLRAIVLVLAVAYAIGMAPFFGNAVAMLTLAPEQSLAHNTRIVNDLIPDGSVVMTDSYWWVLGNRCHVRDPWLSLPDKDIDFIIFGGDGTRQYVESLPSRDIVKFADENFDVIHGDTRGGFCVVILRRRTP